MAKLTEIQTIRFSKDDILLIDELKRLKIKPDQIIRLAFREKLNRDLPILLKEEQKRKSKEFCPF